MNVAAVILAAGKGTRMRGDAPKVLHAIDGRPMLAYVIDAIRGAGIDRIFVVVGYRADEVIAACGEGAVQFVRQEQQLGTGHAVLQCERALGDFDGTVVVLNGDVPALRPDTIRAFREAHAAEGAAATVLTATLDAPAGYGRIVRNGAGDVTAIVEERDADGATRAIKEINSGLFCFEKRSLFDGLKETGRDNAQAEYYLTDVISVLRQRGDKVRAFRVNDCLEVAGVNTDSELEAVRLYVKGRPG